MRGLKKSSRVSHTNSVQKMRYERWICIFSLYSLYSYIVKFLIESNCWFCCWNFNFYTVIKEQTDTSPLEDFQFGFQRFVFSFRCFEERQWNQDQNKTKLQFQSPESDAGSRLYPQSCSTTFISRFLWLLPLSQHLSIFTWSWRSPAAIRSLFCLPKLPANCWHHAPS